MLVSACHQISMEITKQTKYVYFYVSKGSTQTVYFRERYLSLLFIAPSPLIHLSFLVKNTSQQFHFLFSNPYVFLKHCDLQVKTGHFQLNWPIPSLSTDHRTGSKNSFVETRWWPFWRWFCMPHMSQHGISYYRSHCMQQLCRNK